MNENLLRSENKGHTTTEALSNNLWKESRKLATLARRKSVWYLV